MTYHRPLRWTAGAVLAASFAGLAACGGEREAEAETSVSEAEVTTELPESVVSDQQLQNTAEAAAGVAASPPPTVVAVPVPAQGAAPAAGMTSPGSTGTAGTTGAPTTPPAQ